MQIFLIRPKKKSLDNSLDIDYIKHTIKNIDFDFKYILHLRPTTPIRKVSTINNALKKFLKLNKNYTSLRTMTKMSNPSYRTFRIHRKPKFQKQKKNLK